MPLKPAGVVAMENAVVATEKPKEFKSYAEIKDSRILYQGLTQAALQSMPLGQFASDIEAHLKNVMATVDALAVFVLDRSK